MCTPRSCAVRPLAQMPTTNGTTAASAEIGATTSLFPYDEHMEVVEAIKNRDPDAAMRVMSTHLDRTAQLVKSDGTPP